MLTRDEATTRVARGAAHLDQVRPGWFNEIDTGTLSIESSCLCILGQVYGSYDDVLRELGWKTIYAASMMYSEEAACLGFSLLPADVDGTEHAREWDRIYRLLQDAWVAAIAQRCCSAQAPAQPPSERCGTTAVESPVLSTRVSA